MRSCPKEGVPGGIYNPDDFFPPQSTFDVTCLNWTRSKEVTEEQKTLQLIHKLLIVELVYPSNVATEIILKGKQRNRS